VGEVGRSTEDLLAQGDGALLAASREIDVLQKVCVSVSVPMSVSVSVSASVSVCVCWRWGVSERR
jgi:hypothetical protein